MHLIYYINKQGDTLENNLERIIITSYKLDQGEAIFYLLALFPSTAQLDSNHNYTNRKGEIILTGRVF